MGLLKTLYRFSILLKKSFYFTLMTDTSEINATRPGEYLALFIFKLPTMEGIGHAFITCDAYSEYAIYTGVEKDQDPATVLRNVYLLMENKEFVKYRDKGFTLVLEEFEELSEKIEQIIKPLNGKLLYDKALHSRIALPVRENLSGF